MMIKVLKRKTEDQPFCYAYANEVVYEVTVTRIPMKSGILMDVVSGNKVTDRRMFDNQVPLITKMALPLTRIIKALTFHDQLKL